MIQQQAKKLPNQPGVYLFKDESKKTIYIGKAKDLRKRVASYFRSDLPLGTKTVTMIKKAVSVSHIATDTEFEALLLESDLIKRERPKYNILHKDDKAYKYIKITLNEDFPRVITSRQKIDDGAKYFGPFPEGRTVNLVLKQIRRIFPYCNEKIKTGKACFYVHLELCPGPCDGRVSKTEYRRQINRLVQFLSGRKKTLISSLERQMKKYTKEEKYEKAAELRDLIERIEYVTQQFHLSSDFIVNPNLRSDLRQAELSELMKILINNDLNTNNQIPTTKFRIEAYDMSHTSNKEAVGSMVVFIDGEPIKRMYRRFRIKEGKSRSDTDFMQEVLRRRFSRTVVTLSTPEVDIPGKSTNIDSSFSSVPDLILVDGGVPQVNMCLKVLDDCGLNIPLIGLAKRWEKIVLPSGDLIALPKDSSALQLLQRIRDEAHRFARAYHIKLRSKSLLEKQ